MIILWPTWCPPRPRSPGTPALLRGGYLCRPGGSTRPPPRGRGAACQPNGGDPSLRRRVHPDATDRPTQLQPLTIPAWHGYKLCNYKCDISDRRDHVPITPRTIFRIVSVSKSRTVSSSFLANIKQLLRLQYHSSCYSDRDIQEDLLIGIDKVQSRWHKSCRRFSVS